MSTAYFFLTEEGRNLAHKLAAAHPGDLYDKTGFKEQLRQAFHRYDYLVCIMATGIVVRILAPLLVHKTKDPGVVVLDQNGHYAISLLSGHLGGANNLAREMAFLSGGQPVITTATDVAGELSFDTFAQKHDMAIQNIEHLKYISGALLDHKPVQVFTDRSYRELTDAALQDKLNLLPLCQADSRDTALPAVVIDVGFSFSNDDSFSYLNGKEFPSSDDDGLSYLNDKELSFSDDDRSSFMANDGFSPSDDERSSFSDSDRDGKEGKNTVKTAPILYLRPRTIYAGIGCKKNREASTIEDALLCVLKKERIHPLSLKSICTIPLKAEEPGILTTARHLNVPLTIVQTEDIEQLDVSSMGIRTSDFVASKTGVLSVSTASAYLASGKGTILVDKAIFKGVTIALCQVPDHKTKSHLV
ncbi:MAG: cobalamin biosynthesis protein [Clostridiales bacterium]|nr:cobalamin biosynthesis protein [Clostridiales bacterium]